MLAVHPADPWRYVVCRVNKNGGDRCYWQRRGHPIVRLPADSDERAALVAKLNADADVLLPRGPRAMRKRRLPGRAAPIGTVYAIQSVDGGPIKFGYSDNVPKRLAQIQTNHHARLVVLATRPGRVVDEREIHRAFAAHRLNGEWFAPAPEVLAFVAAMG